MYKIHLIYSQFDVIHRISVRFTLIRAASRTTYYKNCPIFPITRTYRPQKALYIVLKANKRGKTEQSSKNHIVSHIYSVKHLIEIIYNI